MTSLINSHSVNTVFPDHDACFGDGGNLSSICQVPSAMMINFLNITNPSAYLDMYCLNPPSDSCSFGYCPNSDVASPAVRFSAYFTSIVSAILVLYCPDEITGSFFAQLLNIYSQVIAAVVAIGKHDLTKLHSVIALSLAASPLSVYLVFYVLRTLLGRETRLKVVLGEHHYLNRALVLLAVPLWISVLIFSSMPTHIWEFQQAACDIEVARNKMASLFFLPFVVFFEAYPEVGSLLIVSLVIPWSVAIWRLRIVIWARHDRYLPLARLWRKVVEHYPFIQFYTVLVLPHTVWIFNLEFGLASLSPREKFTATYGQLLAIFVTIPPLISLCLLLSQLPPWFADLTWVRFIARRGDKPYISKQKREQQERKDSTLTTASTDAEKAPVDGLSYIVEGLPSTTEPVSSRSSSIP
ncbi:hypothetical protein MIND_00951100 [Mycena indigotica]|uniref:Uncharacterized protein n=1 Tax=Mycena indigotica TaxID=2126181 RepID=A0A8H6SE99_9AGAR|nr:uncharacterized protein MIND_00951100 [Mycena indigotica]KAF7297180.1 hypothetical protein MIND_00951100 [Mycena indigotica]